MVKNAGSKNKCGRLMKNMKSPNSGLTIYCTPHSLHAELVHLSLLCLSQSTIGGPIFTTGCREQAGGSAEYIHSSI